MKPTSKSQGFTLIELLFVVAIIAIIMSVGISAYSNYSKEVADEYGKILIDDIISREKAYYIHYRTYTLSFQDLGFDSATVKSEQNLFQAAISVCSGDKISRCVEVTAKPLTEKTSGTIFSRDTRGNQKPLGEW